MTGGDSRPIPSAGDPGRSDETEQPPVHDPRSTNRRSILVDDGVGAFLSRFCVRPDVLRPVFDRRPQRVRTLRDGEHLCRQGDPATGFWIILDGQIRVERESYDIRRRRGDVVGEVELYQSERQARGSTLSSSGGTSVFGVDREFVDDMSSLEAATWHETMARVLATKLDQSAIHRDQLRRDKLIAEALVRRFVCPEGREAALAALVDGPGRRIDPEVGHAVIWFSDVTGFSALVETLELKQASAMVRQITTIQEEAVHAHGGQVDKYMGDGIMAFWRCSDERQLGAASDAAVSAALECASTMTRFLGRHAYPCDIRVGLHGGPVMIGDFAGNERIAFTLIGQAVNAASRYEQAEVSSDGGRLGRVRLSPLVFEGLAERPIRHAFEHRARRFLDKHARAFEVHSSVD